MEIEREQRDSIPTLEEELRLTRNSVNRLSMSARFQKFVIGAVAVLVLGLGVNSYFSWKDRQQLRDSICRGDRVSALNTRAGNEAMAEALIDAGDTDDPDQQARIDRFLEDLKDQQERLVPVPEC